VNQFVEECRREWKRLRVPDPVADEMAAELTADLDEAAAEGASPEEVLGRGASDPRSFAAAWAAERGVVPPQSLTARLRRRSPLPVAIAALTIVAAVGAALVVFASPNAAAPVAAVRLPSLAAYPTKAVVAKEKPLELKPLEQKPLKQKRSKQKPLIRCGWLRRREVASGSPSRTRRGRASTFIESVRSC
jgi:hypothetical protein